MRICPLQTSVTIEPKLEVPAQSPAIGLLYARQAGRRPQGKASVPAWRTLWQGIAAGALCGFRSCGQPRRPRPAPRSFRRLVAAHFRRQHSPAEADLVDDIIDLINKIIGGGGCPPPTPPPPQGP